MCRYICICHSLVGESALTKHWPRDINMFLSSWKMKQSPLNAGRALCQLNWCGKICRSRFRSGDKKNQILNGFVGQICRMSFSVGRHLFNVCFLSTVWLSVRSGGAAISPTPFPTTSDPHFWHEFKFSWPSFQRRWREEDSPYRTRAHNQFKTIHLIFTMNSK